MTLQEVERALMQYTEVELSNKEQYLKNGETTMYNYAWKFPPNSLLADKVSDENSLFFVLTGMTDILSEEQYFEDGYEIALLKHDRYAYPFPHKHTFFEVLYVLEGECVHEVEGERRVIRKGEMSIVSPGVQHSVRVFDDSVLINILIRKSNFDYTFHALTGRNNTLSDFFTQALYASDYKSCITLNTREDGQIRDTILNMFMEVMDEKKYSAPLLNHMLITLFYRVLQSYEDTVELFQVNTKNDVMIQVLQYIRDHFTTVTLDDLAKQFFFNKYYLSRLIRERTGSTFSEIVQKTRLDAAARLLANSDLHLWEIGHAVGYNDITHMARSFKKHFGVSPKEYRQANHGKTDHDSKVKTTTRRTVKHDAVVNG